MKVSENFDIREFVPPSIWNKYGEKSTWFINQKMVKLAEFYKKFFLQYYQKKLGPDVVDVLIVINDYHYTKSSTKTNRGYRTPDCTEGASLSQHKCCNAFDCDIIVVMRDGSRFEADYKEIAIVIKKNEAEFMRNGLTVIEDVAFAPTWLHSDCRWTGLDYILIVKP